MYVFLKIEPAKLLGYWRIPIRNTALVCILLCIEISLIQRYPRQRSAWLSAVLDRPVNFTVRRPFLIELSKQPEPENFMTLWLYVP